MQALATSWAQMTVLEMPEGDLRSTQDYLRDRVRDGAQLADDTMVQIWYTNRRGHRNMRRYIVRAGIVFVHPAGDRPLFRVR